MKVDKIRRKAMKRLVKIEKLFDQVEEHFMYVSETCEKIENQIEKITDGSGAGERSDNGTITVAECDMLSYLYSLQEVVSEVRRAMQVMDVTDMQGLAANARLVADTGYGWDKLVKQPEHISMPNESAKEAREPVKSMVQATPTAESEEGPSLGEKLGYAELPVCTDPDCIRANYGPHKHLTPEMVRNMRTNLAKIETKWLRITNGEAYPHYVIEMGMIDEPKVEITHTEGGGIEASWAKKAKREDDDDHCETCAGMPYNPLSPCHTCGR